MNCFSQELEAEGIYNIIPWKTDTARPFVQIFRDYNIKSARIEPNGTEDKQESLENFERTCEKKIKPP